MTRLLVLAGTTLLLTAEPIRAGEHYFIIVFGSQRPVVNLPAHAHSFATFIRLREDGDPTPKQEMDYFTISWLPYTLDVRLLAPFAETGVNLTLQETLERVTADGQAVAYWGPYEINADLYGRAWQAAGQLNGGAIRYKAIDSGHNTARVTNCMHALSDLAVGEPRLRVASPGWGHVASHCIALRLAPWMVDPCVRHDWLVDCLGLNGWDLRQRRLDRRLSADPLRFVPLAARVRIRDAAGNSK